MSAAPLKLDWMLKASNAGPGLRTLMSAAPLKQRRERIQEARSPESPHSHECGPVEASMRAVGRAMMKKGLRTLMSAAPLKRFGHIVGGCGCFGSPHSHECGPVEAP